jgi:hypothetical protein
MRAKSVKKIGEKFELHIPARSAAKILILHILARSAAKNF